MGCVDVIYTLTSVTESFSFRLFKKADFQSITSRCKSKRLIYVLNISLLPAPTASTLVQKYQLYSGSQTL
jgi:hypothetical protein